MKKAIATKFFASITLLTTGAAFTNLYAQQKKTTVPVHPLPVTTTHPTTKIQGVKSLAALAPLTGVNTFAGNGQAGFTEGPGMSSSFNYPTGTATDAAGNIYIADSYNHRIRKISPAGLVTTVAGNGTPGFADGPPSIAQFNFPYGVAVDPSGNIYVADHGNNAVRKITPSGVVSTMAGTGAVGHVDGAGNVATFNQPQDIVVDASGNVYVSDRVNNCIRKITPAKVVSTLAGSSAIGYQDGVGTLAKFYYPNGLGIDAAGNIYVADSYNQRIRKVTPLGVVTTFAGNTNGGYVDGAPTVAQFLYPYDIAFDAAGNAYVADLGNERVRKIIAGGTVSTVAGSGAEGYLDGASGSAQFSRVYSLAVDPSGNIFIADIYNQRIRKVQ